MAISRFSNAFFELPCLPMNPDLNTKEADDFFQRAIEHEQKWKFREELAA